MRSTSRTAAATPSAACKTQGVPGRIRKSNFKDLAMAGKRVIMPQQNVDVLFNQPLEITIDAEAKVKFSLARRQRLGALRREHHPDGAAPRRS